MSDAVQAVSQFMQPINQGIEAIAPVAGIASAIPGFARQWGIQGQLMQPGVPKIPPQVEENIRQAVEGGSMSAFGSAAPALTARGESSALADWLLNFMGLRNQALSAAGGMNQGGDLASMIAAATGGLGGNYSNFDLGSPDTLSSIPFGPNYPTQAGGYPVPYYPKTT